MWEYTYYDEFLSHSKIYNTNKKLYKYYMKIKEGKKTRYFYTKAEWDAYKSSNSASSSAATGNTNKKIHLQDVLLAVKDAIKIGIPATVAKRLIVTNKFRKSAEETKRTAEESRRKITERESETEAKRNAEDEAKREVEEAKSEAEEAKSMAEEAEHEAEEAERKVEAVKHESKKYLIEAETETKHKIEEAKKEATRKLEAAKHESKELDSRKAIFETEEEYKRNVAEANEYLQNAEKKAKRMVEEAERKAEEAAHKSEEARHKLQEAKRKVEEAEKGLAEYASDASLYDEYDEISERKRLINSMEGSVEQIMDTICKKQVPPPSTKDEDMQKYINPYYDGGLSPEYSNNCSTCTLAYEFRQRGWDVESVPDEPIVLSNGTKIYDGELTSTVLNYYDNPNVNIVDSRDFSSFGPEKLAELIETSMVAQGDGARGNLSLYWKSGGGHSVVYEVSDGKAYIRDCQTGEKHSIAYYLQYANYAMYYRTDDLNFTKEALAHVRNRKEEKNDGE